MLPLFAQTSRGSFDQAISWWLGLAGDESVERIESVTVSAPWAREGLFWLFVAAVACCVLTFGFYLRYQTSVGRTARWLLACVRSALLVMLLLTLAAPVANVTSMRHQRPLLLAIFDGTASMKITDESEGAKAGTRTEQLQDWLRDAGGDWISELVSQSDVRLRCLLFDGDTTTRLRELTLDVSQPERLGERLADQLSNTGQVTAMGAMFEGLTQHIKAADTGHTQVLMFSDFAHNLGPLPNVGENRESGVATIPIHCVGVGVTSIRDVAVELQIDPRLKRGERARVSARVRQSGLAGEQVRVQVWQAGRAGSAPKLIGNQTLTLTDDTHDHDFNFVPDAAGSFTFTAEVAPLSIETNRENNRASRDARVLDDYLRLLYVADEPTWEWRFVKEVFHRDRLVGLRGFRTFLASSDPRVRQNNPLFEKTPTPERRLFFANDVIFLGDLPKSALSDQFCRWIRQFVGDLGGGLVVIAGPRFGPAAFHRTPLEELLPVIVDPNATLRDAEAFPLVRTPLAAQFDFMRLADESDQNERAWENLDELPWYQPVRGLVPNQATVLAEHPTDMLEDGVTKQPLIAQRRFGRGEVVYLAFNEMWRLRALYGEQYYQRFWSQLIYRLGMSHALGHNKRFVARLTKPRFRVGERVFLQVEAYDDQYQPLAVDRLTGGQLEAEIVGPAELAATSRAFPVPYVRDGFFETEIRLSQPGQYRLRVRDPIAGSYDESSFSVSDISLERRSTIRDSRLQAELARDSNGSVQTLESLPQWSRDLDRQPREIVEQNQRALWTSPIWLGCVVLLMVGEWLIRKQVRLL